MNRVLITGAAELIGRTLREGLRGRYPSLRLSDIAPLSTAGPARKSRPQISPISPQWKPPCRASIVVHLGAIPGEDTWEKILPNNIVGTWNVFEAARRQKVRRVVYASSHHAVGFYRRERDIDQTVVPRPDGIYGVSKVFGEGVGRLFADKHGLSVACLRIGAFRDKPTDRRLLYVWLSPRDAVQLVGCCIDAPAYHFITVYGISDNARSRYRNVGLEFLGYRPQDKAEDYADRDHARARYRGRDLTAIPRRHVHPDGLRRRPRASRLAGCRSIRGAAPDWPISDIPRRLSDQRPALLNDFASSPAALNDAIASFVVMATVVFVSATLPPAAATAAIDNAASLFGHSMMTNQSSSPNVR